MKRFAFLLFIWCNCYASDPNTIIDNVNVATGSISYHQRSLVVDAVEPLIIAHSYTAAEPLELFFPHLRMKAHSTGYNIGFSGHEPNGVSISFRSSGKGPSRKERNNDLHADAKGDKQVTLETMAIPGLTNTAYKNLSARNNPQNNRLTLGLKTMTLRMFLPDGGRRYYKQLEKGDTFMGRSLEREELPNGNVRHYEYAHDGSRRLLKVSTHDSTGSIEYAYALFSYEGNTIIINTSDGQRAVYSFSFYNGQCFLDSASIDNGATLRFSYCEKGKNRLLQEVHAEGLPIFHADYNLDDDRIASMRIFTDSKERANLLRTFSYKKGSTESRDAKGILTTYHFDSDSHLVKLDRYKENDVLFSSQHLTWAGANLIEKALFSASGQRIFSREFHYDAAGNVLEDIFHDDAQQSIYKKSFTYSTDGRNLLVKEVEDSGITTSFEYLPGTDHLSKKLLLSSAGIFKRFFFLYDKNKLRVAEFSDDGCCPNIEDFTGVTERKISRVIRSESTGLPIIMQEKYWDGEELLLSMRKITYNNRNKVVKEDFYDATETFLYSLYTDYDERGTIVRKTDPIGRESLYEYDERGRIVFEQKAGECSSMHYCYDYAGRQISSQEIASDGSVRGMSISHDVQGRPLTIVDEHGLVTENIYDALGNCIETRAPAVLDENGAVYEPILRNVFDEQGNAIKIYGADGSVVVTTFNAFGAPLAVTNPDGSMTRNIYAADGIREKVIGPDLVEKRFRRDIFNNVIAEETFAPNGRFLCGEYWEYNAFHMLSHTDTEKVKTVYSYDRAGRKIAEQSGAHRLQFTYDSRGYLKSTRDMSTGVTQHLITDIAGRKSEEWIEQPDGTIENHTVFHNTSCDRISRVIRDNAVDEIDYDGRGRKIAHRDPLGVETVTLYEDFYRNALGQHVLRTTTVSPNGMRFIETCDSLSRVVVREKRDPSDELLHKEELFYDRGSNLARSVVTVFKEGDAPRTITNQFVYDSRHMLISKTEGGIRTTSYSYDVLGREVMRTKPDGNKIFSSYDNLGRIIELCSSDGSIWYHYVYGVGSQPIRIKDRIAKKCHTRSYDINGNLIVDTNSSGITLRWTYDAVGRPLSIKLPDRTFINYSYNGSHLSTVSRPNYIHRYKSFDSHGFVAEEELAGAMGTQFITNDLLDRPIALSSPCHTISQSFTINGEIEYERSSLFGEKNYEHDLLSHLIREEEETYSYDSVGNPADIPVDDLNQLQRSDLSYDLNGNLLTRDEYSFRYDALDRLTMIQSPDDTIIYTYDPFGRLESKKSRKETLFFISDHDSEIGAVDENGALVQLRVLGTGNNDENGAAIALELHNELYIPFHDLRGNLIALASPHEQAVVQTYRMNAYGQCDVEDPLSPWRFSSKRHEEADMVCFRHRFYDTTLKRWLTPDPAGTVDGANRYGYVLSNPVNRLDQWGLYGEPLFVDSPYTAASVLYSMTLQITHNEMSNAKTPEEAFIALGMILVNLIVNNDDIHYLRCSNEEVAQSKKYELTKFFNEASESLGDSSLLLVSWSNGINNSPSDSMISFSSIKAFYGNQIFTMGLYNETEGLSTDAKRVVIEKMGYDTPAIVNVRFELLFYAKMCEQIGDNTYVLKILHSEAGLLYCNAVRSMTTEEQLLIQKHILVAAFGPAEPVPKDFAHEAINIYSKSDHITGRAGKNRDSDLYDIRFVDAITPRNERNLCGLADHAYMGATYQKAAKELMRYYDDKYKAYRYN